jgi:hypothetical protein
MASNFHLAGKEKTFVIEKALTRRPKLKAGKPYLYIYISSVLHAPFN